jgi:hypothetical protein
VVAESIQGEAGRYSRGTEGGGVFQGETLGNRNYVLWLCDDSGGESPVTIFAITVAGDDNASPHGDLGVGALFDNTGDVNPGNKGGLAHDSGRPGKGEGVLVVQR